MTNKPEGNPDTGREEFAKLNIRNVHYEPLGQLLWADTDKGTMRLCDLRGWGHLTGGGAWNLPTDEAAKIQDAIGHALAEAFQAAQQPTQPAVDVVEQLSKELDGADTLGKAHTVAIRAIRALASLPGAAHVPDCKMNSNYFPAPYCSCGANSQDK